MGKIKIVLDSDVVIDFKDANRLFDLPKVLPGYDFVILDIVLNKELAKWQSTKEYIMKHIEWVKTGPKLSIIPWLPDRETLRIYAELRRTKGIGESACMAYCQTHHDVLASCNLKDTRAYCEENGITYVTFLDLVWYAWRNGVMTEAECDECIQDAIAAGNKVPNVAISQYTPTISNL
ncbi:MAG TPA: hypothetical protein PLY62_06525 [Bacteroidales bacterium]|jgi:hypothetical protein|nr:hypothetical protein [Bacteroidales bacterium]